MNPRMEVKALKTKYPQGSERQLIFATTGRAINSTMLPADAGWYRSIMLIPLLLFIMQLSLADR